MLGPDSSLGPMIAATILPLVAAGRGPAARGRARLGAGADDGGDHRARRRLPARLRRGPDLEAHDDRLHERAGPDDPGRPTPQALRLLGGRGGLPRRGHRLRQRCGDRRDGPGRPGDRRVRADPDRGAPASTAQGSRVSWSSSCCRSSRRGCSASGSAASRSWASCRRGSHRSPSRTSGSPTSALLLAGALGIALVSLADTISTASAFAARTGQVVDGNREMIGIGAANIAAGPVPGVSGQHERFPNRRGASRRAPRRRSPGWSERPRSR